MKGGTINKHARTTGVNLMVSLVWGCLVNKPTHTTHHRP